ncbi:hypothetical protein X777_00212 [Ooceraea biroi]|uniref:Uncharacterized protein n=1 Tax=Ooceraea biroi TaxID=2015173 RepID=A0A026VRN2_OOCBI|nr:hypothetical protein X777_00212 [Ooceraea biroi]
MPRCLMAKKWKWNQWQARVDDQPSEQRDATPGAGLQEAQQQQHQQPQPQQQQQAQQHHALHQTADAMEKRQHRHEPEDEEIDVVGDVDNHQVDHQQTCWGPHSPTAGATAPSPPPLNASGALYYHGE